MSGPSGSEAGANMKLAVAWFPELFRLCVDGALSAASFFRGRGRRRHFRLAEGRRTPLRHVLPNRMVCRCSLFRRTGRRTARRPDLCAMRTSLPGPTRWWPSGTACPAARATPWSRRVWPESAWRCFPARGRPVSCLRTRRMRPLRRKRRRISTELLPEGLGRRRASARPPQKRPALRASGAYFWASRALCGRRRSCRTFL